jgi:hypothetical protein
MKTQIALTGIPKAIADRLYKELAVILNLTDTKKVFEDQGAEAGLPDSAECNM